jgi:hypothetical protein
MTRRRGRTGLQAGSETEGCRRGDAVASWAGPPPHDGRGADHGATRLVPPLDVPRGAVGREVGVGATSGVVRRRGMGYHPGPGQEQADEEEGK